MTEIARRLGIGRSTLYRKLREYDLEGAVFRTGRTRASDAVRRRLRPAFRRDAIARRHEFFPEIGYNVTQSTYFRCVLRQ